MNAKHSPKINHSEFGISWSASSSGIVVGSVSRHSRAEKVTSCTVTVLDLTNNNKERFEIPAGHYSKKQMQKLRNDGIEAAKIRLVLRRK